jgi:acetyl-CoA C-acetyltransferase
MAGSVIVAGARTPIGKLSGALASFSRRRARRLRHLGRPRAGRVTPDQVDYVFMGHVLQAGAGQITARQAAVNAGIGMGVPATTVNKVCPSGLQRHLPGRPDDRTPARPTSSWPAAWSP